MDKLKNVTIIILLIIVGGISIFAISNDEKKAITHEGTARYFPIQIDFSGEKVPLNIQDVRERLDRELLINANLHATTILIMKRANRVFPVIEPILEKYGVPDDFKYLAVIESGLVNVVSPAGARGVWQFMPETAKEKGMEISETVDERYHLEKSTEAACKYLIVAKEKFGSWTLAAASYNGGMTGINKQIAMQQVSNYYDLLLNEETSRYVFRILALKEIMQNAEKYGFSIQKHEMYNASATKQVLVDSTIVNLADFAKQQGINYKLLKLYNPWLRDTKLENKSKKPYNILIPVED